MARRKEQEGKNNTAFELELNVSASLPVSVPAVGEHDDEPRERCPPATHRCSARMPTDSLGCPHNALCCSNCCPRAIRTAALPCLCWPLATAPPTADASDAALTSRLALSFCPAEAPAVTIRSKKDESRKMLTVQWHGTKVCMRVWWWVGGAFVCASPLSPRLCMVPSPFQLLHHSWARRIHSFAPYGCNRQTDRQTDSAWRQPALPMPPSPTPPPTRLQDVRVVEAAVPVVTDPQDVILRVTSTAICGSDLHLYTGKPRVPPWGRLLSRCRGPIPAPPRPATPRHATPRPCSAQGRCRA